MHWDMRDKTWDISYPYIGWSTGVWMIKKKISKISQPSLLFFISLHGISPIYSSAVHSISTIASNGSSSTGTQVRAYNTHHFQLYTPDKRSYLPVSRPRSE